MIESINDGRLPRMADPTRQLDHEIMLRLVVRLRSEGRSSVQIGEQLGVPDRTVRNWLSEATSLVKADNRQFMSEMFAIHQHRCESLYDAVRKKLADSFSTDLVKTALLVLDRQAKLLGLDRGKGTMNNNDWMESASTDELIAEAKRQGIPLPETFNATGR